MVLLPVALYFLLNFHIINALSENDVQTLQTQNVTISLHSHNNSK